MRRLPATLIAGLTVLTLVGCGGSDADDSSSSSASSSDSASPSATASSAAPSASSSDTSDASSPDSVATDVGLEAQAIGLDVANYSVNNDFTPPADQAEFEAKVDYAADLKPGSKVGYQALEKGNFQVCVTHYDGTEPTEWAIFDGATGLPTSGTGAPTEEFCA